MYRIKAYRERRGERGRKGGRKRERGEDDKREMGVDKIESG